MVVSLASGCWEGVVLGFPLSLPCRARGESNISGSQRVVRYGMSWRNENFDGVLQRTITESMWGESSRITKTTALHFEEATQAQEQKAEHRHPKAIG